MGAAGGAALVLANRPHAKEVAAGSSIPLALPSTAAAMDHALNTAPAMDRAPNAADAVPPSLPVALGDSVDAAPAAALRAGVAAVGHASAPDAGPSIPRRAPVRSAPAPSASAPQGRSIF
jgi:hypothetical protein